MLTLPYCLPLAAAEEPQEEPATEPVAEEPAAAEAAAAAAENLAEGQEAPAVPEITLEPDELETRFNAAFQTFKDNKAAFIEELEQQKQKNLESKTNIIEGLKRLLETETNLKVLNDHVKAF